MTVRDILKDGTRLLEDAGIENAAFDARQLLCKAYGITSAQLLTELGREICPGAAGGMEPAEITHCPGDCGARLNFDSYILQRRKHVPLQHILGEAEFMGLTFGVNEHVLIPRQDTETLVELVLDAEKEREISVLDLCTGSGCIAISLKKLGGFSEVTASDISAKALQTAQENAKRNEVRITFMESDVFEQIDGSFDVIVSNPPYIRTDVIDTLAPEVKDHDPAAALDGGTDGLVFYRRITEGCRRVLKDGGRIYYEIGFDQAEEVAKILAECGFTDIKVTKDLTDLDRVVSGRFCQH